MSALKASQVGCASGVVRAGAALWSKRVRQRLAPSWGLGGGDAGRRLHPCQRRARVGSVRLQALSCSFRPAQLHYLRLPKDISEDHVILMDCTVSTGAAAMMAVRVLLVWRTLGMLRGEAGLFPCNTQNISHSNAGGLWGETGSSMGRMV